MSAAQRGCGSCCLHPTVHTRARGQADWDVTSAGGVSGEQAGQEGGVWGRRSLRCTCGWGQRGQRRVPVSAALSDGLPLKWAALTLIGFDPSGPTLSDLGGFSSPEMGAGGTALSPCEGGRYRARGVGRSGWPSRHRCASEGEENLPLQGVLELPRGQEKLGTVSYKDFLGVVCDCHLSCPCGRNILLAPWWEPKF